jgi:hypothetical protein
MRNAPLHFFGGAPREGEKQDAARIGTMGNQIGNPMRKRLCLARSGSRDDEQGARQAASGPAMPYSAARRCSGLSKARVSSEGIARGPVQL